jgi:hypothetical protein
MHNIQHKQLGLGRLAFGFCVAACFVAGPLCFSAHAQEQLPKELEDARKKASEAADKLYGTTMKLNRDVANAIGIVRGIINEDPFAVINVLIDLIGGSGTPDITITAATKEIIDEMRTLREDEIYGEASALLERFDQLVSHPENMTFEGRLENYIDDSSKLFHAIDTIMNDGDPQRAEMAYHLAPAFNTVAGAYAMGLAMAKYPQDVIDDIFVKAINTNMAMISNQGYYGGSRLYNVVQRNAGPWGCSVEVQNGEISEQYFVLEMDLVKGWVSSNAPWPQDQTVAYRCNDVAVSNQWNARFDADPMVALIRRSTADQYLALVQQ